MTFRTRILLHTTTVIGSVVLLAAATVVSSSVIRARFATAAAAEQSLRLVYEIGLHIESARREPDPTRAAEHLARAQSRLPLTPSPISSLAPYLSRPPTPSNLADTHAALARLSTSLRDQSTSAQTSAARLQSTSAIAVTTAALLVTLLTILSARRQWLAVIPPLSSIASAARRVARADHTARATPTGDAEFKTLARDFNHMADQLQQLLTHLEAEVHRKSTELTRQKRLTDLSLLATGVAHEINNPLSIITGYAERALLTLPPSQSALRSTLEVICEEAFRARDITQRLLALSRPASLVASEPPTTFPFIPFLQSIIATFPNCPPIIVDRPTTFELPITTSEGALRQILTNLLSNALHATSHLPPPTVRIHLSLTLPSDLSPEYRITISDNGLGMTRDQLDRAFEPFYSDRPGGVGLGLPVSATLTDWLGGRLSLQSPGPSLGTTADLHFPATPVPISFPPPSSNSHSPNLP